MIFFFNFILLTYALKLKLMLLNKNFFSLLVIFFLLFLIKKIVFNFTFVDFIYKVNLNEKIFNIFFFFWINFWYLYIFFMFIFINLFFLSPMIYNHVIFFFFFIFIAYMYELLDYYLSALNCNLFNFNLFFTLRRTSSESLAPFTLNNFLLFS